MADSLRKQCGKRWEALKSERSSWMPHWQEISEVLLPRAGRFLVSDNNKGTSATAPSWTTQARERFAPCRAA